MYIRRSRLATIVASAAVLVVLLMPGDEVPKVGLPCFDKLVHVLLFFPWALALRFDWEGFRKRPVLLVAAVAVAGPLTEALQLLAPGRSFDLLDMAADLAGAALAAAFGAPLVGLADRLFPAPAPTRR
jgi:VanZ family protein